MAYILCEGCNRVLNEEDGPICGDCITLRTLKNAREDADDEETTPPEDVDDADLDTGGPVYTGGAA